MIAQINIIYIAIIFIVGIIFGYFARKEIISQEISSAEEKIRKRLETSESKAGDIVLKAQMKASKILEDIKNEEKERKKQLDKFETILLRKEDTLDKKGESLDLKEKSLNENIKEIAIIKEKIEESKNNIADKLEKVAGLSKDEAKNQLIESIKTRYEEDLSQFVQKMMREGKDKIDKKVVDVLTTAMQRYARSYVSELTTTAVSLPDEGFKGKIIGKEGRNIRAIERLTGVELVIDETPDSVIISSFNPIRRAVAKSALEKLIKDGRIQPSKIEEKVEEASKEIADTITKAGEDAVYDIGIYDFPKEIIQLLGRLNYRTSYGQNVLQHSIEVAYFSEMIASELGLDAETAKRGGLLHDIGKSIDHEVSGSHVDIGKKILKKYNINESIISAMESHHEEYPYATPESYVIATADIISAARPGARRDTIENYIKRLSNLENMASEFSGVKNAYAISAGRELRVFVSPDKINDFESIELAKKIADKIQSELKYPGEIKVVVIRETKAVEYAK